MQPMEIFMDESKRGFVALSSELKKKSPLIEGDNKNIKSQLLRYFSMDKRKLIYFLFCIYFWVNIAE